MPELLNLHEAITNDCAIATARCLIIAVSGGPDSLALLHRLHALQPEYGWRLHVAHLDHGLRGAESANEARFVAVTAAAWGLSATIELRDVGQLARIYNVGLPAAARAARYAFLADVALAQHADAVVVGHQADDQAETVLLHLLRGAGPSGLNGMLPRTAWDAWKHTAGHSEAAGPALVRPLLRITRAEVEEYCATHALAPRRDPTNDSIEYRRGRIRHQLLPQLTTFNPQIVAALGRTARIAAQESDFMQQALDAVWPRLALLESGSIHFEQAVWSELHEALQRLAVRRAVSLLRPEREPLSALQLDRTLTVMASSQIVHQLPHNLILNRHPQGWTFTIATTTQATANEPQLHIDYLLVDLEQPTAFPGGGWQIQFQHLTGWPSDNLTRWQILLDGAAIKGGLYLRQRQPGDRIRPAGAPGSRRVQDIMVDLRLPRELRAQWPLLSDAEGLIWIPGLVVAERVHPNNDTIDYLLVTLEEIPTDAS